MRLRCRRWHAPSNRSARYNGTPRRARGNLPRFPVAGARWLSNEVDKKLLKAAASEAAGAKPTDNSTAKKILMALDIAKSLPS